MWIWKTLQQYDVHNFIFCHNNLLSYFFEVKEKYLGGVEKEAVAKKKKKKKKIGENTISC